MYGAIIGDIAGSIYENKEYVASKNDTTIPYKERIKILDKETPLFTNDCTYTDDSILTIAIADALLQEENYEKSLRKYGIKEVKKGLNKYGHSYFGNKFIEWLANEMEGNSYGNGGAMRVGPIGYYFNNIEQVVDNARAATIPSHNNDEAIICAEMVAVSIYLLRNGVTKEYLKDYLTTTYSYNFEFNLKDLQQSYTFKTSSRESVPQAIYCFLISNDFENTIRTALSIGGDSDTIASIAGSLAEAHYGVPKELIEKANTYLPEEYIKVINDFYSHKNKSRIK